MAAMNAIKAQLLQIAMSHQACMPLPTEQRPGSENENKLAHFLVLVHTMHSTLRYCFQCIEMGAPTASSMNNIIPTSDRFVRILARLSRNLMLPKASHLVEMEFLRILDEPSVLVTVLLTVYNAYLRYPVTYRTAATETSSAATREAVLGWQKKARSSLPLLEAGIFLDRNTGGYASSNSIHFWKSRVLNALTVSPDQGQLEWLALITDTMSNPEECNSVTDLEWYNLAVSDGSGAFEGSQSLVINEAVMTPSTVEGPNELLNLIHPIPVPGRLADIIYAARLGLAQARDRSDIPQSLQPAPQVRAMMRHVKAALRAEDPQARKGLYEKWILSEWDAPSILFSPDDIKIIISHFDDAGIPLAHLPEAFIRSLVIRYRGLKAVCARVRLLVQEVKLRMPQPLPGANSTSSHDVHVGFQFFQNATNTFFETFQGPIKYDLEGYHKEGLTFNASRVVGTDANQVAKPRRLWDMVFNVAVESIFTSLPWVAVSHSWSQADGDCFSVINERANVIPWSTREDLKNVRSAVLETGFTLAWMDKICLRQRGQQGFDDALRLIEWATDIPLIDKAYSGASKILVYIEGAGRPLQYRTTFREGSSWLHRKWTAQETPRGVELALGSGGSCLDGDFFGLCSDAVQSWHEKQHHGTMSETESTCQHCNQIRDRLNAIWTLRELPELVEPGAKLHAIWDVVRGRAAGCEADHVFSLLALMGVKKRPRYDARYSLKQAAGVVREILDEGILKVLEGEACATWFDGIFRPFASAAPRNLLALIGAFSPDKSKGKEVEGATRCPISGILSNKRRVVVTDSNDSMTFVGQVQDGSQDDASTPCKCQQPPNSPLAPDARSIHTDYFEWHGDNLCCVAFLDFYGPQAEVEVLKAATHLLVSKSKFSCLLLEKLEQNNHGNVYGIRPGGKEVTFTLVTQFFAPSGRLDAHDITVDWSATPGGWFADAPSDSPFKADNPSSDGEAHLHETFARMNTI